MKGRRIKVKALVEVEIDIPECIAKYYLPKTSTLDEPISEELAKHLWKVGVFESSDLTDELGNKNPEEIKILSSEIYVGQ